LPKIKNRRERGLTRVFNLLIWSLVQTNNFVALLTAARRVANAFGVISPKTRMSRVSMPVEIPTSVEPNLIVAIYVAIEAATILTTLFPINMVMIILRGCCLRRCRLSAPFHFCFRNMRTRT